MQTHVILGQTVTHQELIDKFNIPVHGIISGCKISAGENDPTVLKLKKTHALSRFPVKFFSGSAYKMLITIPEVFENPLNIFDRNIVNVESLRKAGFGINEAPSYIEGLDNYKKSGIELRRIIGTLAISGGSTSTIREVERKMSGLEYSFESKTKAVVQEFLDNETFILEQISFLENLGFKIIFPIDEIKIVHDFKYVLTGSPKQFGFKTKDEFKRNIPNATEVGKIKDATHLITDSLTSTSSKTKEANKLGVNIITYAQAIELLNS